MWLWHCRSTPCPNVKQGDEWSDPSKCENGDACGYCHTRTEQQFHLEVSEAVAVCVICLVICISSLVDTINIAGFPLVLENPWESLNLKDANSTPWKSLKMKVVLESPWNVREYDLLVLENFNWLDVYWSLRRSVIKGDVMSNVSSAQKLLKINMGSIGNHKIYTVSQKKVPTFKLFVTLSNLNQFSKFLHCWKAYEICYKTHMTLPTSP